MQQNKTLFENVIDFCHNQYISAKCEECGHFEGCPSVKCGNCKQCLEEIHYPYRHPNGWRDYECDRMINFYVCDYTAKYASEMLYLMRRSEALSTIEKYHVLSLGCGACPDLIALERFCQESSQKKRISYLGIDVNERWKHIHEQISLYKSPIVEKTSFKYCDVISDELNIADANVVILQYIISHFYNTDQILQINDFFKKLIKGIVRNKQEYSPMVILINDVNSFRRGRDFFIDLVDDLQKSDFHGTYRKFYFDRNIVNSAQRYGIKHTSENVIFEIPEEYENIYQPWHFCSSAQLLIEVY